MSLFKRVIRTGRGQKGFTMVEVMLATFIMAFTSVGLIGMFNSSTQLSNVARERKDAQRYAETISETITAIPFYQPYDGSHDIDVDDHFWGSATDRGGSITTNNWSTAPYVTYSPPSNIADSRYTATVKMVYVLSDLSTKNMKSDWVPKDGTGAGLDKPTSVDAVVYHLIKFEVKVSWKSTLAEGSTTRSETYVTLMSDTQYEANLGVSGMTNVDPGRPGSSGANSGPHTAAGLMVQITGHGFVTGQTITASLVMQGVADIPVNGLTRVNDTTLTGTVNLNTGNGTAPPWQPRRDPGQYTVRVNVGVAYAYAYKAFVVEFPVPTGLSATPTGSDDSYSALAIKVTGTNVLNLGYGSAAPYNTAYSGAIIRLVQYKDKDGNVISNGPTISGIANDPSYPITYGVSAPGGYGVSNWVQQYFNLQGQTPGQYYVEVCNCQNNQVALKPGDVISANTTSCLFTLTHSTPTVSDAYVAGSVNSIGTVTNEVYVGSGEKRHFAYKSRVYHYTIKVEGLALGTMDTVKIGVNGDPTTGTTTDPCIVSDTYGTTSSVVVSSDHTYLTANFDFSAVSDSFANTDDSYPFWIYVYNSATPTYNAYKTNVFQVRKPRPIVYKNADYIAGSGPGDFYHNYAPIPTRLTGECFDSSAYNIKYKSGNYTTMGNQNWQVGSSDGGMVKGSPTLNGTRWDTQLNLIHCLTGLRNVWVETTDATPITDNGFISTKPATPYTYSFYANVLGGPGGLPAQSLTAQTGGAVTITNYFDHWYGASSSSSTMTEQVKGPTANTETSSTLANAQINYTSITHIWWWLIFQQSTTHAESCYSIFSFKCQGLRDTQVVNTTTTGSYTYGATTVTVYTGTSHASPVFTTTASVADPATPAAAQTDRNNLYVSTITTGQLTMLGSGGTGGFGFTAYDVNHSSVSSYNDGRYNIIAVWPNNDNAL